MYLGNYFLVSASGLNYIGCAVNTVIVQFLLFSWYYAELSRKSKRLSGLYKQMSAWFRKTTIGTRFVEFVYFVHHYYNIALDACVRRICPEWSDSMTDDIEDNEALLSNSTDSIDQTIVDETSRLTAPAIEMRTLSSTAGSSSTTTDTTSQVTDVEDSLSVKDFLKFGLQGWIK